MQQIHLPEPTPDEEASPADVETGDWFFAPPFAPEREPWVWLTPTRAKEVWRLSKLLRRFFDFGGEWFGAWQDRPEYVDAFRQHVLSVAAPEQPVFVLHGHSAAAFTTVGGFLECWPRLRILDGADGHRGYDMLPLDLAFWLQIIPSGTANIGRRSHVANV